jgi:hypothetical protein
MPFAAEPTDAGRQTLVPGVAPITGGDRLALRAAAPMRTRKTQRPCDFGLFDLAARPARPVPIAVTRAGRRCPGAL